MSLGQSAALPTNIATLEYAPPATLRAASAMGGVLGIVLPVRTLLSSIVGIRVALQAPIDLQQGCVVLATPAVLLALGLPICV
jgi:hypothetical protein